MYLFAIDLATENDFIKLKFVPISHWILQDDQIFSN